MSRTLARCRPRGTTLRSLGLAGFLLLAADPRTASASGTPTSGAAAPSSWWGLVRLGNTPVGSVVERRRPLPDGGFEATSELTLAINRAGTRVEMNATAVTREAATGELLSARLESRLSSQVSTFEAERVAGGLRLRSGSGSDAPLREQIVPVAGSLLGPEAVRRRTLAELRSPGDTIAVRELIAELGGVYLVRRKLVAFAPLAEPPGGRTDRPARGTREIEETTEGVPDARRLWLDEDGELLREREPSPFGDLEVVRTSRAEAEAARSGGQLPEEIYSRSLARSNVRLPSPRGTDRLHFRLLPLDPAGPAVAWPDLDGGNQRVVARQAAAIELEVRRPAPPAGATPESTGLVDPLADELAPNVWIESDDPEVVRLARTIVAGERDRYRQALALTAWVHREMHFDLGIVMAPASELVRTRRGTCAGYATLLAALSRAVGIPARFVMGSVYLLGAWGGHAWVELEIGGRWLPFDATVYSPGIADAARIAYSRDSLRHGFGGASLAGLSIVGKVRVEVLDGDFDGVRRDFAGARAPSSLAAGRYENPGLGLRLVVPDGFVPSHTEAVWPDPVLLELADSRGTRAVLREGDLDGRNGASVAATELAALGVGANPVRRSLGGAPALVAFAADRAGAVWVRGTQVISLVVEGSSPGERLAALAEGMVWRDAPESSQASSADGP